MRDFLRPNDETTMQAAIGGLVIAVVVLAVVVTGILIVLVFR